MTTAAPAPVQATLASDSKIAVRCAYSDRHLLKTVPGYEWHRQTQRWLFPLKAEIVEALRKIFPYMHIAPEVVAALKDIQDAEAEIERLKREAADVEVWSKTKPYDHQRTAYAIARKLPAAALLMEMGTGKTKTAIDVCAARWRDDGLRRVLVVAPKSVVPAWPQEFEVHCAAPYRALALEPPWAKGAAALESFSSDTDELLVVIINYEATWRIEKALAKWRPQLIIADESQRIKSPSTNQSKAMHRLGRIADWRMILTGTPVTQAPLDFFSQYKFLDPGIFGNSYYAFRSRYAVTHPQFKSKVLHYKKLDELVSKAHSIAYRVTKAEALDLPETVDQTLYCDLSSKGVRAYQQMAKDSVADLESGDVVTAPNVLAKLLRLQQITGGWLGDEEGNLHPIDSAKQRVAEETIEDLIDAGKKVVVFCRFLQELRSLAGWLDRKEIGYRLIDGSVPQAERGQAVADFQDDPDVKVFIAQIATAGLGITLTAADTAIFYSTTFSYADYEQARARLHRIGQRNAVTYIHLVVRGTVDEHIVKVLRAKGDLAELVVDRWRELLKGD